MLHHDGNHDGEDGDERVEHHNRAGLFEVVAPEEGEVECEKQHHDCNEDDLADDGGSDLALCGAASFHLALKRLQHLEGASVDDVATINDFLTGKHHATGDGDATQHIGAFGLAAFLVVNEVRLNIFVQVASLQRLSLCFEARVLEDLLVGRQGGIERMHRHTLHLLTRDDLHHRRRVLRQLVEVRRVHDAGLIELVQLGIEQILIGCRQPWQSVLEVGKELLYHLLLDGLIVFVVGLQGVQQRVLLALDHLVGFVDGEVELRNHRSVGPRLVDAVSELLSFLTRHEPNDECHGDDDNGASCEEIAPIIHFVAMYSVHFPEMFAYYPAKIQKNYSKLKKKS